MLIVERPEDLAHHLNLPIGPSEWTEVTQEMVDQFARVTGDHQWIHVDVERAKREAPGGRTIAHGFLILSLLGTLLPSIYEVRGASRVVNYGSNRVRYLSPVPTGSRVRASMKISAVDAVSGGHKVGFEVTVEIEGDSKPALVAETIVLYFE